MIRYRCLPVSQLSAEQMDAWSRLQLGSPYFDSPFFRPEFSQLVAEVRTGCEVAVIEEDSVPVGFLPFQRHHARHAWPIAGTLTDMQGVVAGDDLEWNVAHLLRDCGLSTLGFDRALGRQQILEPYHWRQDVCPYIDVGGGMDAYRENRRAANSNLLSRVERKVRKLQRDHGPIRLEPHTADAGIFEQLIQRKADQYKRRGSRNVFAKPWTAALLARIRNHPSERLSGVLSVLYVGERIAAMHFGIRSGRVLNCWFPVYDPALRRYSPGLILFVELIRAASAMGVDRIDLGAGPEKFKRRLMTGATPVANVCIDLRPAMRPMQLLWMSAYEYLRTSHLRTAAHFVRSRGHSLLSAFSHAGFGHTFRSPWKQMGGAP